MTHSFLFLADGFEEIEALATVDVLRRAGMVVNTVALNADGTATGAHGVTVCADRTIENVEIDLETQWLICPGGMPGASNLANNPKISGMLTGHWSKDGRIAAICASPAVVLAPLGILDGRKATCYPGFEDMMASCTVTGAPVEVDGNLITGNGPGNSIAFALAIVKATCGEKVAAEVRAGMLV